jgi:hypothetical protein
MSRGSDQERDVEDFTIGQLGNGAGHRLSFGDVTRRPHEDVGAIEIHPGRSMVRGRNDDRGKSRAVDLVKRLRRVTEGGRSGRENQCWEMGLLRCSHRRHPRVNDGTRTLAVRDRLGGRVEADALSAPRPPGASVQRRRFKKRPHG